MKDRQPAYPGRVKLRDVSTGEEKTYDLTMADEPTEVGDPPTKATLLKDATAALFGLGADAVPDDVLAKISEMIDSTNDSLEASKTNSAVGTFTSRVTLPFTPDAVWVSVNISQTSGSGTTSGFLYPGISHYLAANNRYVTWNGTRITGAGGGTFRYVALKFGGNA